jgi:SprT protein
MRDPVSTIKEFVPGAALPLLSKYLELWKVNILISRKRVSKHGDFRAYPNGGHRITVNQTSNPYRFLITTLHEIAHLVTFLNHGVGIKPHGTAWKKTYQKIMQPFLTEDIFPEKLLTALLHHFKNPKASSDSDLNLSLALNKYEAENEKNYIFELEQGVIFEIHNGKKFVMGKKRVKRFECRELSSLRIYLFSPNAQVKKIE